jgi:hypothetical protein
LILKTQATLIKKICLKNSVKTHWQLRWIIGGK